MTTIDQRAAFIRAICEDPFDIGLKQMYIDWLITHGNEDQQIQSEDLKGHDVVISLTTNDWLEIGPKIVRISPITEIEITDKKPWTVDTSRSVWFLTKLDKIEDFDDIPAVWFYRLSGDHPSAFFGNVPFPYRFNVKSYSTVTEARTALSRACIDWAREKAGLPKLDWSKKR